MDATRKKRLFRAAVVLAFVIPAVLLLLAIPECGPLHGTVFEESNEGWLTYCPKDDAFDYMGDCLEVDWSTREPLSLWVETANPYPAAPPEEVLQSRLRRWNRAKGLGGVGFDLLVAAPDRETADIILKIGEAPAPGALDNLGDAAHYMDGGSLRCVARTFNTGPPISGAFWHVVDHEIGHCIGLAHDRWGLMAPDSRADDPSTLEEDAGNDDRLLDEDVALVRQAWGHD